MLMYENDIKEDEKEKIIIKFLPYIKYIAYRLSWNLPPYISIDDLISVGLMGLMRAVEKFKPGKVKLRSYAELRIKGSMIDELRSRSWTPRAIMMQIKKINDARTRLQMRLGRMPDDIEVAQSLKMPLDEYFDIQKHVACVKQVSLEDFRDNKHADSDLNITECIVDMNTRSPLCLLEEKEKKERLTELIYSLPENKKMVLTLYYYEELTLKEISRVLNLTESRVCQIHKEAIGDLKMKMLGFKDEVHEVMHEKNNSAVESGK